jgi:hypothetical protein
MRFQSFVGQLICGAENETIHCLPARVTCYE